jgi:nicotinamidase-related amidase
MFRGNQDCVTPSTGEHPLPGVRRFQRRISVRPKTLLEMAGVTPQPSRLEDAAVVVIDAQREYVDGLVPLAGVQAALGEIGRLLAAARQRGTPVIHVKHRGRPGGAFDPGGTGSQIAAEAAPSGREPVVEKALPNAFAGTDLKEQIDATGKRELILAGFMTHMCVEATARAALDLGLKTTVIASATATRDLPDPVGGQGISATEVQRNALAALNDRFAVVVGDMTAVS